jgi:hypothetical protein
MLTLGHLLAIILRQKQPPSAELQKAMAEAVTAIGKNGERRLVACASNMIMPRAKCWVLVSSVLYQYETVKEVYC